MSDQQKVKNISRRTFLRAAALASGAAFLASCAPAAQEAANPAGEEPVDSQAPAENITISWWNQFSTPTTQEVFPKVVDKFTEKHPNIKVEFEITGGPPGGGDYIEIILARIAAGNPPNTITLWTPPSQFGARGALADLTNYTTNAANARADAFYEGPLQSCMWKGKIYGLPASAGAGCIFINKAMFEEAGISSKREDFPTTWDGLKDLSAKFVKSEGGEITQAGFIPWTGTWLRAVWSELNGGKIFDAKELKYKIDSDANQEMVSHWLSYLDDQYGGDIEKFNLVAAWGDVYPDSGFALGKNAIDTSGSWACTDVEMAFEWEVAKFPVGPKGSKAVTGYWPNWFASPKGAANMDESFLFNEWMTTEGWLIWYEEGTMDTPAWKKVPEGVYTKKLAAMHGEARAQELHNFFAEYLNNTAEMWTSPVEDFANDTIGQAIDEILHKVTPVAEALAVAQETCQAKLDETLQTL